MRLLPLSILFLSPVALAGELRVPGQYGTLARALAVAVDGDVIVLAPGEYRESLRIHSAVTLRGAGPGTTLLSPLSVASCVFSVDAGTGPVRIERMGFRGDPNSNLGECVLHSAGTRLELADAQFLDLAKGVRIERGSARFERLRFERCRGDAVQMAFLGGEEEQPGVLELVDVRVTAQSMGYGARSLDGTRVVVDDKSRLTVCVEGPAELVTHPDGTTWPHATVWNLAPLAQDATDEPWTNTDAGGDIPWTNTDAGNGTDAAPDEVEDVPAVPEMPREQRLAAYARIARELNDAIGPGAELEREITALGRFLEGLYALGDQYGWYSEGGEDLFCAEIARFAQRHGRAGVQAAQAKWPANPQGNTVEALFNRRFGYDFQALFVREDIAELVLALEQLEQAPDDDTLDAAVIDAYAALFARFAVGTPAIGGAQSIISSTLSRLDISVTWRLVQLATTSESVNARNFAYALLPDTRRALLRHWREL
ncbi:MAG: hypothetical protein IT454_19590 [Planctomycetes bacterium]|nr:hypothetical protein [Planctomycetota bacterium]